MLHVLKGMCHHIYNWLLKLLFSRSFCTINHTDIQSKVIVSFQAKGPSLVVLFVCISSSNSYNNILMYIYTYDIVKGIIQQY